MKEINLEEILKLWKPWIDDFENIIYPEWDVKEIMKEAIRQALEIASEQAKTKEENYIEPGMLTMMPLYRTVVDKQSILDVIKLVK